LLRGLSSAFWTSKKGRIWLLIGISLLAGGAGSLFFGNRPNRSSLLSLLGSIGPLGNRVFSLSRNSSSEDLTDRSHFSASKSDRFSRASSGSRLQVPKARTTGLGHGIQGPPAPLSSDYSDPETDTGLSDSARGNSREDDDNSTEAGGDFSHESRGRTHASRSHSKILRPAPPNASEDSSLTQEEAGEPGWVQRTPANTLDENSPAEGPFLEGTAGEMSSAPPPGYDSPPEAGSGGEPQDPTWMPPPGQMPLPSERDAVLPQTF
jgi:hypothetical protein